MDRLSLDSSKDYDWFETSFISLFEGQILLDETLYCQAYFYFFDMIANGHPQVYGLKKFEQEYIYLENTAVTGGVRVLEYQDRLVLLTLSGYD